METEQPEFDFIPENSEQGRDGLQCWREQRRAMVSEWALKLGLPLEEKVDVTLICGQTFRGVLLPHETDLFARGRMENRFQLEVDGVPFGLSEIASCVRI